MYLRNSKGAHLDERSAPSELKQPRENYARFCLLIASGLGRTPAA